MAGTPFSVAKQVTLDATGAGTVELGPSGVDWVVKTLTVSATTATRKASASVYIGGVTPANFVEGSMSGSTGDTSDTVYLVQPGTQLFCVWAGGDAGAKATLRVAGKSYPAGQGAAAM